MEDELMRELEDLRTENKILRDSLVEYRPEEAKEEAGSLDTVLRSMGDMLSATAAQAKEALSPGTDKLTDALRHQMRENPIPMLLAAFGAGYIVSRRLERK